MTTIDPKTVQCAACGAESEHPELMSVLEAGYYDLDGRPPEMLRSTMFTWIQRCPECGYCYCDISMSFGNVQQVITSPEYQDTLGESERVGLAALFSCKGLIDENAGRYARSAEASIHAAWVFDDASDGESAKCARNRALCMHSKAEAEGQSIAKGLGMECAIVVDILRRAGRLKDAETRIDQLDRTGVKDLVLQILDFQSQLIQDGDTECHTVEDLPPRE